VTKAPVKTKAPAKAPVKKAAAKKPVKKPAKKAPAKGKPPITVADVKAVVARLEGEKRAQLRAALRAKLGRPSAYQPEYCQLATNYCLMGATDAELAKYFYVAEQTINNWKLQHPEFLESIANGREKADAHIAASMYHRAKGYSHVEDDIRTVAMGMNQGSEIVITPTIKHYPPDTAAASLWLRNRQPGKWRDKVDVEHSGRLRLDQLPDGELTERLAEVQKRLGIVP